LYSFGLVGDLMERWTSDELASSTNHPNLGGYSDEYTKWVYENDTNVLSEVFSNIDSIPENYFPTSHFKIVINQTSSQGTWINQIPNIINAIDGIRPINTVFENVVVMLYGGVTAIHVINGSVRKEIIYSLSDIPEEVDDYFNDALFLETRDISGWTVENGMIDDAGELETRIVVLEKDAGDLETRTFTS
jgi:hypothetical protein